MPYPVLQCRDDILRMFGELAEWREKLLTQAATLTPEQLHDPVVPGTWSILKNLQHLAVVEPYMLEWIKRRPNPVPPSEWPTEPAPDLAAIRQAFDEGQAASIAFLKGNDESVLTEPCVYGRAARPETVGGVFFHLIEHEIHHRAIVLFKLERLKAAG